MEANYSIKLYQAQSVVVILTNQCYNLTRTSMKLSHEQVKHIAWLARLRLSPAETEKFSLQLSNILENFEILKELSTENVPPATHTIPLQNIFRKDEVAKSYPQNEILANAPKKQENCFKVKAILE
jgi:aspartyl-tRNA(Asn)/glutamyl-tRNA(Gln) amidotransferase subunit C